MNIAYGLKLWSNNVELFGEAKREYEKKSFDFIEILCNPRYPLDYEALAQLRDIPVTIHSPNTEGFHRFIMGEAELEQWRQTVALADFFNSRVIVVHAGRSHTMESFKKNLALVDDPRIHLENQGSIDVNEFPLFSMSLEELRELHRLKPFCFDFEKAVKVAAFLKLDYKKYITDAMHILKPTYLHVSGGDPTTPEDQHWNLADSPIDFAWIKKMILEIPHAEVVFETPKKDGITNDIANMDYFRKL